MSVQTLYTAATGMESLETKLDVIANNLANVNTVGFKKDRANFEDLFYRNEVLPGAEDSQGQLTAVGIQVGLGSRVSSVQSDFTQGAFQQTGGEFDLAIEGNGFFRIDDPATGQPLYTRAGNFSVNANNALVLGSASLGRLIDPPINFSPDNRGVVFSPDGVVSERAADGTLQQLSNIQLAYFQNPEGLLKLGDNLYSATEASGAEQVGVPGQDGLGLIRQTALEASNVEPVQELIDLITTQRAFELNSQTVQAGDQILELVANLRRF